MKLVSFKEFADIQGVHHKMVTKWKDQGRLVLVDVPGRKYPKVNVEASQRLIKNTTDISRAENGRNAGGKSKAVSQSLTDDELTYKMKVARVHREEQEAMMAELKLKVEAGELVMAALVDQTIVSVAADLRMSLERLPNRVAAKLCEMCERVEIEKYLLESVDEILADLAESIRSKRKEFIDINQQEDDFEAS
nr:hypothetical protein 5 [Piscirickettsiaceae bacterium]